MNIWYTSGVYTFLLGCMAFTYDSIKTLPLNKRYLTGCILFDIGCLFFALDVHNVYIQYNF